jgi:hypothetical protein
MFAIRRVFSRAARVARGSSMALPLVIVGVLSVAAQSMPPRIDLEELTTAPERVNGTVVEVRGSLHADDENIFLCTERIPPHEYRGCQAVGLTWDDRMPAREQDKLVKAIQTEGVSWLTVRGRFEATGIDQWKETTNYRFALVAERVIRIEPVGQDQAVDRGAQLEIETRRTALAAYYPGSFSYIAVLTNETDREVAIVGTRTAGGDGASGLSFRCGLESWEPTRRAWRTVATEENRGGQVDTLVIPPGGRREVCWVLLPGTTSAQFDRRLRITVGQDRTPGSSRWASALFQLRRDGSRITPTPMSR